jgi:hypothetical protein
MKKFTKPFLGAPNGEVYPREFAPGDDCPPELEVAATQAGALAEGKKSGPTPEEEAAAAAQKAELIAKLDEAKIPHDKRWGIEKLTAALAEGKKD